MSEWPQLSGATLIAEAARWIRETTDTPVGAARLLAAAPYVADLLDRAAAAFPIDLTEPPRNPIDRRVVMGALFLAGEILASAAPPDAAP